MRSAIDTHPKATAATNQLFASARRSTHVILEYLTQDKPTTRAYCINFSAKTSSFSGIIPKIDIDGSNR